MPKTAPRGSTSTSAEKTATMAAALHTSGMLSRTVRQKTEPRLRTVKTCSTLVTAMTKKHVVCPTPKPAATAPGSSTKRPSQNASRPTAENATVCCSVARTTSGEKKLSLRPMGLRRMMRSSEVSWARCRPGMPSPSTLVSSSMTGVSAVPQPASCAPSMTTISDRLQDTRKYTVRLMFEKTFLPSRTASTMVAKLSSVSTMSAAAWQPRCRPRPWQRPRRRP